MIHAPSAVTPLDPERIEIGHAIRAFSITARRAADLRDGVIVAAAACRATERIIGAPPRRDATGGCPDLRDMINTGGFVPHSGGVRRSGKGAGDCCWSRRLGGASRRYRLGGLWMERVPADAPAAAPHGLAPDEAGSGLTELWLCGGVDTGADQASAWSWACVELYRRCTDNREYRGRPSVSAVPVAGVYAGGAPGGTRRCAGGTDCLSATGPYWTC